MIADSLCLLPSLFLLRIRIAERACFIRFGIPSAYDEMTGTFTGLAFTWNECG